VVNLGLLSSVLCMGGRPPAPAPPPPPPPPPPPAPPAPIASVASKAKSPTEKATTAAKKRTARKSRGKGAFNTLGSGSATGLNIG